MYLVFLEKNAEFIRSVGVLAGGTAVAQLIPVLITPVLTRLWSPEAFGGLATYIAVVSILGMVSLGRLDMALMLPKKNDDALRIIGVSLLISITFALLLYFAIGILDFFGPAGTLVIHNWYYLIPLGVLLYSGYSLMISWHNRNKNYISMSKSRVFQSSSTSGMQVALGSLVIVNHGLIISDVLGRLVALILIVRESRIWTNKPKFDRLRNLALLSRYRMFPLLEAPASLINTLAQQLPFLVFPFIFSSVIAGQYFLVVRVLIIPASLIGSAVLEVFKNKAQEDFVRNGNCTTIFIRTGVVLLAIGSVPAIILWLFAPNLFSFVFGPEWGKAGEYAQILTPLAWVQFVASPLSYVLVFREKLWLDLKLQATFLFLVLTALFVGAELASVEVSLRLLVGAGILFYAAQIYFSYKASRG
jgi:O-antigen/teichoic acid export membrane protein